MSKKSEADLDRILSLRDWLRRWIRPENRHMMAMLGALERVIERLDGLPSKKNRRSWMMWASVVGRKQPMLYLIDNSRQAVTRKFAKTIRVRVTEVSHG